MALGVRPLTAEEEGELRRRVAARTLPARVVERAKMIVLVHEGERAPAVGARPEESSGGRADGVTKKDGELPSVRPPLDSLDSSWLEPLGDSDASEETPPASPAAPPSGAAATPSSNASKALPSSPSSSSPSGGKPPAPSGRIEKKPEAKPSPPPAPEPR